jgi:hypothetical protein
LHLGDAPLAPVARISGSVAALATIVAMLVVRRTVIHHGWRTDGARTIRDDGLVDDRFVYHAGPIRRDGYTDMHVKADVTCLRLVRDGDRGHERAGAGE